MRTSLASAVACCALTCLVSLDSLSGQEPMGPKLRIAVLDLSEDAFSETLSYGASSSSSTIEIPPPEGFALGLTEMLTTALVETGRFVVLERSKLALVLEEQDLSSSDRVNQETAAATGRVVAVQALITGGITEYSYTSSSLGGDISVLNRVGLGGQQLKAKVAVDMRLIDAVSGEVMQSKRGAGSASTKTASADVAVGDQSFSTAVSASTPLGKASREALEQIVESIVEALSGVAWSGRVIDVREDLVYINAGSDASIEPGMEFEVYEQQEALIDPDSGLNLGAPESHVGSLRVTQVEEKYSVARVTAGLGFARNNVVRFVGQSGRP